MDWRYFTDHFNEDMMNQDIWMLTLTAASLGFLHTVLGPDHYIPFIMISRARRWGIGRTLWITLLCGLGHVGSSVIIGTAGILLGISLGKLEGIEGMRGNLAAWAILLFGLIYMIWGIYRAIKNKPHRHIHFHENGKKHMHDHDHCNGHTHDHMDPSITPWILFTIFVLGPCEPLIPVLMYPAYQQSAIGVILVALIFSLVTIATMMLIVFLISRGFYFISVGRFEKYTHAVAGLMIFISGLGIVFLGL